MYEIPTNPIRNGFLSTVYLNRPTLGIVIDSIGENQIAFETIYAIHHITTTKSKTEYVIFTQDWSPPVLAPTTGLYHTSDLILYRGDVVVTSINSLYDCLRFKNLGRILWYVYNPQELDLYPKEDVINLCNDKRLTIIARSKAHAVLLLNKYKIVAEVCEELDLEKLQKLFKDNK